MRHKSQPLLNDKKRSVAGDPLLVGGLHGARASPLKSGLVALIYLIHVFVNYATIR